MVTMRDITQIKVKLVNAWEEEAIADLYRAGGWWKEGMDPKRIGELINRSYLFAVALEISSNRAVGMGRVISDGIADAYIQDFVVLLEWRGLGVGRMILSALLEGCRSSKIAWIGLIAEPGTEGFYRSLGFVPMEGYTPMLFSVEMKKC